MQSSRIARLAIAGVVLAWLPPHSTAAQVQAGATIAGVVRDTTGSVLPGVTVEASSPALIEKVRVSVTNDQGLYQIADLRPGQYELSFTLPGFRSLKRSGLDLSAGFTANANADLEVGSVEETITVLGQSPLVDTHSTTRNQSFRTATIDQLPTAKQFAQLAVLIPGIKVAGSSGTLNNQDVGGTTGERNPTLVFHGSASTDMRMTLDGMRVQNSLSSGAGGAGAWIANAGIIEEIVVDTAGLSADAESSGVRINQIPRQGGNVFSGSFFYTYTNDKLQTDNLDAELRASGLTRYVTTKIFDVNPSIGGPIKQDKVWFFYSFRNWGATDQPPGAYYDANVSDFTYTPDLSRPGQNVLWIHANNLRVTAQTSSRSKLVLYYDHLTGCTCGAMVSTTLSPEAARRREWPINDFWYGTWNWTITNRLLLETGQAYRVEDFIYGQDPAAALDGISVTDSGRGVTFRALGNQTRNIMHVWPGKAALSYVTGSHNLKVGTQWTWGDRRAVNYNWGQAEDVRFNDATELTGLHNSSDFAYTFVNGVPSMLTYNIPNTSIDRVKMNLGVYVQEQWAARNLTLNLGARFDYVNGYIPEQHVGATQWVGARDYPRYDNLPNWKDIAPRVGVSYDLFGTGRTALKWNLGRFVESMATGIAAAVNPPLAPANARTTRSWSDRNGDFVAQEDELGPSSNTNFGTANVGIRYADNTVTGWGTRAVDWETSASIQHQLRNGLAVDVGYFRRTRGNFRITDNLLVTPENFDPFCVTSPLDPQLPGGGGQPVCGLYDVTPTKFGLNDNVITLAENFGRRTEVFDGVDVGVSARLPGGVIFQGGTSTGRIRSDSCFVVDSPGALLYRDVTPPFQTQIKLSGIYPLPWWGLKTSASYQSLPGPEITASWAAPAAAVIGLGRPLSGNVRSVTVPLVAPGTMYGERLHQVDMRVSKEVPVGRLRVQGQLDIYNLFNGNVVLAQNTTYGSAWQRPLAILAGRIVKFGVLLRF